MWFPWPSINLSQSLGGRFSLLFFSHFLDEVLLGESFPWVSWAPTCLSGYAIQTIYQDWVYNEQPWGINVHVSPGQTTGLFTACYKSKGFSKFSVPQLWSKPIARTPSICAHGVNVWGLGTKETFANMLMLMLLTSCAISNKVLCLRSLMSSTNVYETKTTYSLVSRGKSNPSSFKYVLLLW